MRRVVFLTDLKGWKSITADNRQDADIAVKDLICFMGSSKSGIYLSIRRYINTLDVSFSSQRNSIAQTDDKILITASAITFALGLNELMDYKLLCIMGGLISCIFFTSIIQYNTIIGHIIS